MKIDCGLDFVIDWDKEEWPGILDQMTAIGMGLA